MSRPSYYIALNGICEVKNHKTPYLVMPGHLLLCRRQRLPNAGPGEPHEVVMFAPVRFSVDSGRPIAVANGPWIVAVPWEKVKFMDSADLDSWSRQRFGGRKAVFFSDQS